jgi:hypothetical protein
MAKQRNLIIETAGNLNKRGEYVARTNQILRSVYDTMFPNLKTWAGSERRRTNFLNDYNGYLLRVLAIELCVILDPIDPSKSQYSIDALLSLIRKYLHNNDLPDGKLFDRPDEIKSSVEFAGFAYLKAENIPEILDDKIILNLLQKEKQLFLKQHAVDLKSLKDARDTFLVHPDMDGVGTLPNPHFFIKISKWCFAYSNLILNTLTASGVRLYTPAGKESFVGRIRDQYEQLFKEMID